jgi:hypothetical protein
MVSLGGSVRKRGGPSKAGDPLTNSTIVTLADKHGRTPAQVFCDGTSSTVFVPFSNPIGPNVSPRISTSSISS